LSAIHVRNADFNSNLQASELQRLRRFHPRHRIRYSMTRVMPGHVVSLSVLSVRLV